MKRYAKILFISLLLVCYHTVMQAQSIQEQEKEITALFDSIKQASSDSIAIELNEKIEILLSDALKKEDAFDYTFTSLNYIGSVYSPNHLMRILSWNYPLRHGRYGYSALFLVKKQQKSKHKIFAASQHKAFKPDENTKYLPTNWYGALYYQIVEHKKNRKTQYFLLGISNYQAITKVKVIEPIVIGNQSITFGKPIFKKEKKTQQRIVFEYKSTVNIGLEYDTKRNRFVFDHLSPSDPIYKDAYHYYGPDFSYDSYQWVKTKWVYQPDIDVRNKK
ncbi:MAG: hypothetical protein KA397_00385 [Paludibacteraceae bacterium]|nr:hypothetical protein [Paludibacteraceae bacterium]MBP6284648.1 hypothetical protein [Paludibacteraceae bacterium]